MVSISGYHDDTVQYKHIQSVKTQPKPGFGFGSSINAFDLRI